MIMTYRYPVLLGDPPWPFATYSAKGADSD